MSENEEKVLLEIKDLTKYFKTSRGMLHAVDHVNLTIDKGKTLGVVGESGCGKSTLGRTVLHLIEPTSGSVVFDGTDLSKLSSSELRLMRKKMQMIFQDPYASLNPRKTVAELVENPLKVFGVPSSERKEKVAELLELAGLNKQMAKAYPHELDGGRRQRIGIARALTLDPEFIVCDEPVSALDVSIQAQILNLLMDLREQKGLTYMFITHDLSVVRHISDEIAVMYLGVVVERAPTHELFEHPLHPYTKELIKAIPLPDLLPEHRLTNSLRGEISDPIEPKAACRFAPRCNYCTQACMENNQTLEDAGNGHQVACMRWKEVNN